VSRFTSAGQFAGFRVSIYGSSDTSSVGNAAQPQLLKAGFWKVTEGAHKTWHMSVSTRVPSQMCSGELQPELLGTQLVMNQDTIAISVPLSAREAQARGYAPGACIVGMGQHWEYDITLGNGSVSWVAGNLQPVVPMYYPPTIDGVRCWCGVRLVGVGCWMLECVAHLSVVLFLAGLGGTDDPRHLLHHPCCSRGLFASWQG